MKSFKKLMIILISLTVVLMTAGTTYGYWDTLSFAGGLNFDIGAWMSGGNVAEASDAVYSSIFDDWTIDASGNLVVNKTNPVYADYTPEEISAVITALQETHDSFLNTNGSSTSFVERAEADYVELASIGSLAPGESVQIFKVVDFSEFAQSVYWAPISLLVSLEQPDGYDISDYMVEVLIDYSAIKTFSYTARYIDDELNYYNGGMNYVGSAGGTVTSAPSYYLTSSVNTVISVNALTGAYNNGVPLTSLVNYRHTLNKPTNTGNFGRLPQGSTLSISTPTLRWINNDRLYPQFLASGSNAAGIYTIGKVNGYRTVARVSFDDHTLVKKTDGTYGNTLPIIINVSRGQKLDANGNVAATQSTSTFVPTVTYKVVKGQVFGSDI